MDKKPLVILAGPTAVGKTALSIALAKALGAEIVSADSMQAYRHMDIGSAKVTQEEMEGVPHHLIDVLEPTESFNVVAFQRLAREAISGIHGRGRIPILVGGTGFYIQAALYDIDFTEEDGNSSPDGAHAEIVSQSPDSDSPSRSFSSKEDSGLRRSLQELAEKEGPEALFARLKAVDPASCEAIHAHNVKRVIRAIEFYEKTGTRISDHNEAQRKKDSPYRFVYFVLNDRREEIYRRIDERVDAMMAAGLLEEVRALQAMGCRADMVSMQGLGYKQLMAHLCGELSLEGAVCRIKRDSRHFAKRQITWFKREKEVIWVEKSEFDQGSQGMLEAMQEILREKGVIL